MILVDTSAWVEFDRATGSAADRRLTQLVSDTDEVAVTEPIVMEVVAGAKDDSCERALLDLLSRFHLLSVAPEAHYLAAARLYRRCRGVGVTPRGLTDCVIAAVAIAERVPLLAHNRDLARISAVTELELDAHSLK